MAHHHKALDQLDRDTSSSDDEDDLRNLVDHNNNDQTKQHSPISRRRQRHSFDVEDLSFNLNRRFNLDNLARKFSKRYLFAVFLPMFILLVYFSVDFRNLFSTNFSAIRFDAVTDRMRESELNALYLLKQQQLGLVSLFNHSFGSNLSNSLNSTSNALLDDLKSAVFKQISLNKEIQHVLLAPHRAGNLSDLEGNNVGDSGFGDSWYSRCGRVDQRFSERKTIEWKPRSNKFLLAICVSGQMSNHLICLEKHMFFAALLNRVLVIPSSKVDYQYGRVLDIEHVNECLGRKVVVTFEEFAQMKKNHIHIDKYICYFSKPELCYTDEEHVKKLKNLGISMPRLHSPWVEDIEKPSTKTVRDVLDKFSSDDDVIAIGDVFYANVEREWVMQPGGPLAHKCKTLIEPSQYILLTAQRFIQTFLGRDYIALHFRRHGFLKFCNAKKPSCFYPIPQAAACISRLVERANVPVIYLSTDAAESEIGLLQSLIIVNGKVVPLVKRPARNSAEKWDALLYRHHLEGDSQVEAMLDKTICAMSSVFIGASGSTFTEDILRLRKDWGMASQCDEYLCQAEEPNFIADN